jgi:hypothetical protein
MESSSAIMSPWRAARSWRFPFTMPEHQALTEGLALMFHGIERLRSAFPNRHFTIDGRLVGDVGEVIGAVASPGRHPGRPAKTPTAHAGGGNLHLPSCHVTDPMLVRRSKAGTHDDRVVRAPEALVGAAARRDRRELVISFEYCFQMPANRIGYGQFTGTS